MEDHRRHRDFVTVLISRFGNIENGEHTGGGDEQRHIYQVTPRTDPLASAKCERDRRIVLECPIFVEESFRLECFRVWIEIWVV
jgi:hypothetical protein